MAIKKVIEVDVELNVDDAVKSVNELNKEIEKVGESGEKSNKKIDESVKGVGDSSKDAKKGLTGVATGFKGIGIAMKAAGIGLIIGLFVALKDIVGKNQKVMDFFSSVMTTIGLVFNAVGTAISNAYNRVTELNGGFDSAKKVIGGLMTIALAPLKLAFYSIKLAVQALQLGWEQSFLGKGRPEKIAELQASIKETKQDITDLAISTVRAGQDIYNNFSEAVGEVGQLGGAIVEEIGKVSVKSLKAQADAIVALKNQAQIARAVNAGLIEDFDRQAEQQRQIRDDVNKSIKERQDANNELNKILDKQEKAMIKNADLVVQAARNELLLNNNVENQVALIEALNEKKAILAQIEGKRSEQLVNQTALTNELNALSKTAAEGEALRAIAQRNADVELIKNEELKLEQKKVNLEIDKEIELKRLQNIIDLTKEGTQARVDAEQERLNKIQEFAILEDTLNAEIEEGRANRELEKATLDAENELLSFEERRLALAEQNRLILEDEKLTENARTKLLATNVKARIAIDTLEKDNKLKMMMAVGNGLNTLTSIVGANTSAGKALAVASSLINTYSAITGQLKAFAGVPIPGYAIAQAIATGLTGFAAVKNILAVSTPGGGGGSVPSASAITAPAVALAPSFNVVGTSDSNQLAQSVSNQVQQPIQAFVVSTEVTTQQALDRNKQSTASFG